MRVLVITTEWPTPQQPFRVPFLTRQIELLQNRGIELEIFHFEGKKNPINYLKAYFAFLKKIRKKKYDLVHAQWGQSALPALFSDLPLIITFRGSDLQGITNSKGTYSVLGKILYKISCFGAGKAHAVMLVSASMRKLLPDINDAKIKIVPSGVNLNLFSPLNSLDCRLKLGFDTQKKIILFGGDPERTDKRYYLANEALSYIDKRFDIELLTVKNIEQVNMPLYINAANLVLLTSKHEGSPNIIKEALACNKPVVSVNVGDVAERIRNVRGSWVVEDTPQSIAAAITRVLDSKDEYESRSSVLELDENLITDQIINIYKQLLK